MGALSTLLPLCFNNCAKRSTCPLGQQTELQFALTPAEGTELSQVNSSFKAYSDWTLLCGSSTKTERQPGLHMRAQLTSSISQNHCCVICSCHTMTPKVGRGLMTGKQRRGGSTKHCQGYPQVSAKVIACMDRDTQVEWGAGDYDSETTYTKATATDK